MAELFNSKIFQVLLLLGFGLLVFYTQVIDQHKRRMENPDMQEYQNASWYQKLWMLVLAGNKLTSAATFVLLMILGLVILNQ